MSAMAPIWAVVPVKAPSSAKQRLAAALSQAIRRDLALAMLEDVLSALAGARGLAGIIVVTVDPTVATIAARHGARISDADANAGHTAAVMGAARRLAADGSAMLTLPGDVPLATWAEIEQVIAAQRAGNRFVIVPARDEHGSNAILGLPRTPCRCASATIAIFRISPRRALAASSPRSCACLASASTSTRRMTSPRFSRFGAPTHARNLARSHRRARGMTSALSRDEALALAAGSDLVELMARAADVARCRSRRCRLLFAQGVHSADAALPRQLPLLHVRAAAARRRKRLSDARRSAGHRPRRRGRGLHARRCSPSATSPSSAIARRARRWPRSAIETTLDYLGAMAALVLTRDRAAAAHQSRRHDAPTTSPAARGVGRRRA